MPVRGTQSLVYILGTCWRRPVLLGLEILWRWSFGIPVLALLGYEAVHLLASVPLDQTGIADFSLQDPFQAVQVGGTALNMLLPAVIKLASWLGPILIIAWAAASGLGRGLVLKRLSPEAFFSPLTLIALQLLRIVALVTVFASWFRAVRWAANSTLGGVEPNLVAYFAWVICLSLGIFTLWALLSWIFSIAPLLAMLEGTGVLSSLSRSLRLGPLTGKLVEVNLVLGIIKLALIVLAMVFSAVPLPFETVMTGLPLYLWWGFVTVLYLVASDFFQVGRLAAFVQLWRVYHPRNAHTMETQRA